MERADKIRKAREMEKSFTSCEWMKRHLFWTSLKTPVFMGAQINVIKARVILRLLSQNTSSILVVMQWIFRLNFAATRLRKKAQDTAPICRCNKLSNLSHGFRKTKTPEFKESRVPPSATTCSPCNPIAHRLVLNRQILSLLPFTNRNVANVAQPVSRGGLRKSAQPLTFTLC